MPKVDSSAPSSLREFRFRSNETFGDRLHDSEEAADRLNGSHSSSSSNSLIALGHGKQGIAHKKFYAPLVEEDGANEDDPMFQTVKSRHEMRAALLNRSLSQTYGHSDTLAERIKTEIKEEMAPPSSMSHWVFTEDHWGTFLALWDFTNYMLTILIGYYEPLTFALFRHGHESFNVWFLNLILNAVFTIDMVLTFFIATPLDAESSTKHLVETNPWAIAKRYCAVPCSHQGAGGWFWIDLITVFPGWVFTFTTGSSNPLLGLRIARLFRMLRLRRLGKRVQHWHIRWGYNLNLLEFVKFLVITSLTCHWMACIWCSVEGTVYAGGVVSHRNKEINSWLSVLEESHGKDICVPEASVNPRCVYVLALYWATMTLTSVGYGDITPQNEREYLCCVLCMLMVGYVWAYIVGSIVNIISTNETASTEWRQAFDELNDLMARRNLPNDLQMRLRHFMHMSKDFMHNRRQWHLLESTVSRGLQREVALHSVEVQHLLEGVFWVSDMEQDAVLDMVRALEHRAYGPFEFMNLQSTMIIMRKGVAGVKKRIITRGDVWGECDILLETPELIDGAMPHTIAYTEILMLKRAGLMELCKSFPKADKRVRRAQIRVAISRAFIYAAACKKQLEQDDLRRRGTRDLTQCDGECAGDGGPIERKRDTNRKATCTGSFAYPGKGPLQLAVLQREKVHETQVDLPEIKQLLLNLMANQASFAEHVEDRLDEMTSGQVDETQSRAFTASRNFGVTRTIDAATDFAARILGRPSNGRTPLSPP